ncbi:adenosylcobalamin-dependent ribonucleoside-diphosphate reductase [Tumebacillus permanentifrigoris]|uniref:Vitamin B12-dependent ribonucleotide reductase n=1 Tax=Tumebacillus permanentifrigoris TaxID=378543 RepID=A0A316D4Z8_9BACL|nr:adenosylcobalamin-dependent ribonucleoside-diphosphate reductase [Tumebacillus permanentifrigoris]PWK08362.1 ribonucleoside-diphosphate reductase class II [Tumebacillus permanentifrigoris]
MTQELQAGILPFTSEDYLAPTGERIVSDRYLLKDTKKETLGVGSIVVAVIDKKRAFHELARVIALDDAKQQVQVELRDGYRLDLPYDQIDVLQETSPREMWARIARGAAAATRDPQVWEQRFYDLQAGWKYVPGGRINASMGTGIQTTSYNCFVIPNVGSMPRDYAFSFGQTLEIQARSGGVGMNLSQVPPQGSLTPVKDLKRSDVQLVLDVWHGDLVDFLQSDYSHSTKVIRVTREFLRAVEEDSEWTFQFPDTSAEGYDELWNGNLTEWRESGRPVREGETVRAADLYEQIVESGAMVVQDVIGLTLVPGDSRGTIAGTLGDMWEALLQGKRVSVVMSSLRPRYSYVRGVNGRSSGAYSWGSLYDKGNAVFANGFGPVGVGEIMSVGCQLTLQGGSRRGALMLILNDKHADIRSFITCKQVDGVITGANLSVGVSEEFMAARAAGAKWSIGYPALEQMSEFDGDFHKWEAQGRELVVAATFDAESLWDEMMQSAWKSAEPGVVFLGRYNQMSNSNYFNPIIATNPCGEQGLPAYGICNLGAVVLSRFAVGFVGTEEKATFTNPALQQQIRTELGKRFADASAEFLLHHIKWEELETAIRTGLRFQDAVIDATYYPFEENRKNQLAERRVGLGIMGLHDLMLFCGIRYGSEAATSLNDVLLGMIAEWCYLESVELAKENGPFPMFDADLYLQSGYMQIMAQEKPHVVAAIRQHGVRNVTTMTIAPTGTTGTMVGCSTGCEPYYAWSYYRNSRLGMFEENAKIVDDFYQAHPGVTELPEYFVTAMDLTPEEHVIVQASLQKWIDSSISKTCNAPNSYTVEDTKRLYDLAYELGCKGVTIYRDGSRSEQVLTLKEEETQEEAVLSAAVEQEVAVALNVLNNKPNYKKARPDVLYGATYKKDTPLGSAYITINDDPDVGLAREVFVNIGKAGSDVYASNVALGRAISLYLSDSTNPDKEAVLVKNLSGIGGSSSVGFGERRITSVPDAIAKSLIEHSESFPLRHLDFLRDKETACAHEDGEQQKSLRDYNTGKDFCPQCHQHSLVRQGGCNECEACGFSKC